MNRIKGECRPHDCLTRSCSYRSADGFCFFPSMQEGGYSGGNFFDRCGALVKEEIPGQMSLDLGELEKR